MPATSFFQETFCTIRIDLGIEMSLLHYNLSHMNPANQMIRTVWVLFYIVTATCVSQMPSDESKRTVRSRVWQPPHVAEPDVLPKATVPAEMMSKIVIDGFDVVLEETPLKDIQARFGGLVGRTGDAGDFLEWFCIHGTDSAGSWVLWLESNELDADTVGGFQWRRMSDNVHFDSRCRSLPNRNHGIELPLPVKLGTTEAKLIKDLGNPTARHGNTLLYVHEHQSTIRGEPYTVTNTLALILRHGFVSAIEVWKNTVS